MSLAICIAGSPDIHRRFTKAQSTSILFSVRPFPFPLAFPSVSLCASASVRPMSIGSVLSIVCIRQQSLSQASSQEKKRCVSPVFTGLPSFPSLPHEKIPLTNYVGTCNRHTVTFHYIMKSPSWFSTLLDFIGAALVVVLFVLILVLL